MLCSFNGTLNLCNTQVFKSKNSEINCKYMMKNIFCCKTDIYISSLYCRQVLGSQLSIFKGSLADTLRQNDIILMMLMQRHHFTLTSVRRHVPAGKCHIRKCHKQDSEERHMTCMNLYPVFRLSSNHIDNNGKLFKH